MISFSHFLLCSFTLFASGTLHAAPSSTKPKTPKPGVLRPQDVVAASSTKAPAYTPEISHAFDPQSAPAISPNGRILAVPRGDVWLYRTETGELLKKIPTKTARYGIAFSPDGNRLAIGIAGPDQQPVYPPKLGAGVIEIWNWTTNKVEKILPSYTYTPFRYSLDGAWIETDQVTSRALLPHSNGWKTDQPRLKAFDGAIFTRWNVEKTEASRAVHVSHLPAAFAADGTAALTFDSNGATGIYSPAEIPAAMNVAGDLPSPKRQFPIDERTSFVALSPDATVLLQNTNNMELRRFDVATGTAGASIRGAYPEGYVGFTGDNILVTSMFGFKSMAYDLDANRVLWQDKDFSRPTVAPDGHVAVYARVPAGNRVQVELQVVSARSGEAIRRIPGAISTTPSRFALAPDGKSVALARGNRVEIRDLPSLKMTRRLSGFPGGIMARTLVWNAANNKLWVFDGPGDGSMVVNLPQPPKPEGVRRFDLLDGAHEGALKWDVDSKTASPALAVSFDGRRVAASDDKEIGVWNAQSGELKWKAAVKGMRYLAFSPDGKTVVASSDYNALEPASLWNAESGTKIRDLEISTPRAPSFSPDGKMLAIGINLLSWPDAKVIGKCSGKQGDITPHTSWSRDGKRFLIARGFSADLWDVSDPKTPKMLADWECENARFDSQNDTIWSSSGGALRVMKARDGQELVRVWFIGEEDWVAATPDGFVDGTPAAMPYLRLRSGKFAVLANTLPARRSTKIVGDAMANRR